MGRQKINRKENETILFERIILDGNSFKNCNFVDCVLVFNGKSFDFEGCSLQNTFLTSDIEQIRIAFLVAAAFSSGGAIAPFKREPVAAVDIENSINAQIGQIVTDAEQAYKERESSGTKIGKIFHKKKDV